MPANTRWIGFGVLVGFNFAVLCLTRPIAEAIGWGHHSLIANCVETAPLFALGLLVVIASQSLLFRTLTIIGGVLVTAIVSSAFAERGHVHWPPLWLVEKDASELAVAIVPACLLVAVMASLVNLSLFSSGEGIARPRHRLSIAGLIVATTALFGTIVWKSHVDLKHEDRLSTVNHIEPTVTVIRLRNVKNLAIYAPLLSGLMICARWVGGSRGRCLVLFLLAVAMGAIARSPQSSPQFVTAAAALLWTTHISFNIVMAKVLHDRQINGLGDGPASGRTAQRWGGSKDSSNCHCSWPRPSR